MPQESVKVALEQVAKALKSGDDNILQKYAMDSRATVIRAAKAALDKLDGVEEVSDKNIVEEVKEEPKKADESGWIDMTVEESKKYQKVLIGYNPHTQKGLIKRS